ncbi:SPOR domain-containing protein [Minwuia sp.]|uniref:SPOR domain-containing protein n=1 Tax=Minwuia sp. TaxID=2493630 RepID=UPI003A8DCA12
MAGEETGGGRWPLFAGLALLAAVMALALTIWFVARDDGGSALMDPKSIPIARAPENPDRERPADRGGEQIPDQDKQVFETFQSEGDRAPERVERLLPAAETPMPEPEPEARPEPAPTETGPEPDSTAAETQAAAASGPATVVVETPDTAPVPPPAPAPKPEPAAAAKPEPQPAPAPAPAAEGNWQVQLAALRDEAAARQTWKRVSSKQKALLGSMQPDISRTDTGSKGIFYRLRVGGFASRDQAAAFCDRLKKAGQDCLVARK